MRRIILMICVVPFLCGEAHAVWGVPEAIQCHFDSLGNVLYIIDCATDSVAGRVCAGVSQDASGSPLTMSGVGDLKNQASVLLALQNAMNDARTYTLNSQAKQVSDSTNASKITLAAPPLLGN